METSSKQPFNLSLRLPNLGGSVQSVENCFQDMIDADNQDKIEIKVTKRKTQQDVNQMPLVCSEDTSSKELTFSRYDSQKFDDQISKQNEDSKETTKKIDLSPMPLLEYGRFRGDEDSQAWKRKRLGQKTTVQASEDYFDEDSMLNQEQKDQKFELKKKLAQVLENLNKFQEKIRVSQIQPVKIDQYQKFFKYRIYEAYKPRTLQMARDYIKFLVGETKDENCMSKEQYNYVTNLEETKLPNHINQKHILCFDSNFESGNLDSAYLVNTNEYNLLLKVDTNSRGHTHWFYFKVLNWQPQSTVTFNILNLARDQSCFYAEGMNIVTRIESQNGVFKSEWRADDSCTQILECGKSEIVRSWCIDDPSKPYKYYNMLKFSCKLPKQEQLCQTNDGDSMGTVMCFAYALPYVYSDLISDLQNAQNFLMKQGGIIKREAPPGIQAQKPKKGPKDKNEKLKEYKAKQIKDQAIKVASATMNKIEQNLILNQNNEAAIQQNSYVEKMHDFSKVEILTSELQFTKEVVSVSLGGLDVYQLSITLKSSTQQIHQKKKSIYILARQHAAETHGSVIMKFLISELIKNYQKYNYLLTNYIVKLVPMVNPDGVTIGNSRCSLVGLDLNRRWSDPNPVVHSEIFFLKQAIKERASTGSGISIFCDLHGHNKSENLFFYGCNKAADEGMLSWTKTRLLPKIFASKEPIFQYQKCKFVQDQHKLSTARVVLWYEMKITNSFTLESSMYGYNNLTHENDHKLNSGRKKSQQFKESDFAQIAKNFLLSIAQYHMLEKQLDKDWLKPNMLKLLGGEAAREKMNREEKDQKQQIKEKLVVNRRHGSQRNVNLVTVQTVPRRQVSNLTVSNLQEKRLNTEKKKETLNQIEEGGSEMDSYQNDSDFSLTTDRKYLSFCDIIKTKDKMTWQDFYTDKEKKDIAQGIINRDKLIKIKENVSDAEESDSNASEDNYQNEEIDDLFKEVLHPEKSKATKVIKKISKQQINLATDGQKFQTTEPQYSSSKEQLKPLKDEQERIKPLVKDLVPTFFINEAVLSQKSQKLKSGQREFQKFFTEIRSQNSIQRAQIKKQEIEKNIEPILENFLEQKMKTEGREFSSNLQDFTTLSSKSNQIRQQVKNVDMKLSSGQNQPQIICTGIANFSINIIQSDAKSIKARSLPKKPVYKMDGQLPITVSSYQTQQRQQIEKKKFENKSSESYSFQEAEKLGQIQPLYYYQNQLNEQLAIKIMEKQMNSARKPPNTPKTPATPKAISFGEWAQSQLTSKRQLNQMSPNQGNYVRSPNSRKRLIVTQNDNYKTPQAIDNQHIKPSFTLPGYQNYEYNSSQFSRSKQAKRLSYRSPLGTSNDLFDNQN